MHNMEEMEMPCVCRCGEPFDLLDGYGSEFHANEVVCESCHQKEEKQVERNEEIEELTNTISDCEYTLKESKERLEKLLAEEVPNA